MAGNRIKKRPVKNKRNQAEPSYYDTVPPDVISDELKPVIEKFGLLENCRQLAMEGWTVIENAADEAFNECLRSTILEVVDHEGSNMLYFRPQYLIQG